MEKDKYGYNVLTKFDAGHFRSPVTDETFTEDGKTFIRHFADLELEDRNKKSLGIHKVRLTDGQYKSILSSIKKFSMTLVGSRFYMQEYEAYEKKQLGIRFNKPSGTPTVPAGAKVTDFKTGTVSFGLPKQNSDFTTNPDVAQHIANCVAVGQDFVSAFPSAEKYVAWVRQPGATHGMTTVLDDGQLMALYADIVSRIQ